MFNNLTKKNGNIKSKEIQVVMKNTFRELAFFCRDINLGESLINKYKLGQILIEKGLIDMSCKIGGMDKNCRYLIASSNWKDLSKFSPNSELGHFVVPSGAFFKVLDIQKLNGKTQFLLLNIPQEVVKLFSNSRRKIEDQIIEKGIEIFNKSTGLAPYTELQSKYWTGKTSFPLGMNHDGTFFIR